MKIDKANEQFVCDTVNIYGSGGPVASPKTLKYFTAKHIATCLRKAVRDGLTPYYESVANQIIQNLETP